jgi:hypothetical protein
MQVNLNDILVILPKENIINVISIYYSVAIAYKIISKYSIKDALRHWVLST